MVVLAHQMVYCNTWCVLILDFVACEQHRRRTACVSAQSDQRPCYSHSGRYSDSTWNMQNSNCLAGVYS